MKQKIKRFTDKELREEYISELESELFASKRVGIVIIALAIIPLLGLIINGYLWTLILILMFISAGSYQLIKVPKIKKLLELNR